MAARLGITPDVALYGAALGGGFPIGVAAFRDRQPPIDEHATVPTPHPVSLSAAEAILSILKNDAVYERLEERTEQLVSGLLGLAERFSRSMTVNRLGSVFAVYLTEGPVANRKGVETADAEAYRKLAVLLRREGILFPPEPGRAAFVSSTHGAKDVEETLASCERAFLQLHQEELP
jgi:glutamate-1-semialdehyde 2,1-aminomutase